MSINKKGSGGRKEWDVGFTIGTILGGPLAIAVYLISALFYGSMTAAFIYSFGSLVVGTDPETGTTWDCWKQVRQNSIF
jgi:hypothetical protein